ncbi:putative candidate secreted effector protein [Blumeria hordei DH14]|uniref:Putative candidate secreted effector protein n=1 Tax=Blumeria graminis f. sp. hordei (strain DH14) TaxID=546991 RepID=N1JR04_BLUG1|nr:putative candidate secreted effector protein [Blumeria hordei DH14]
MRLEYIISTLLFAVGSLAGYASGDLITQFNCANQVYEPADVENFVESAAARLKLMSLRPSRQRNLEPYKPNHSRGGRELQRSKLPASNLKNSKVPKFVIINEHGHLTDMAWGSNALNQCDKRRVELLKSDFPWESEHQINFGVVIQGLYRAI